MSKRTIHEDVQAALSRLDAEDPGLKRKLKKAYGYAVFPAVGKAALVIGGAYGRGEVYERGKVIGYATIAQTTIGVQVGGDTFTEVLVFESKESLDRFKRGRTAFAANASAVLVKSGAGGTADFEKGVAAYAYSEGGMLLEAAIGGQRFHFQPGGDSTATGSQSDQEKGQDDEEEDQESGDGQGDDSSLLSRSRSGLKLAASKTEELIKGHPVVAGLIGSTLLAGVGLLVMRSMRGSSASQESDSDAGEEEDQVENEAEDRAQDNDEESGEDQEEDQDDSEKETSSRFSRSRARA